MLRVFEIKLKIDEPSDRLLVKTERKLKLPPGSLNSLSIAKESIDAREKPQIFKSYSVDLCSDLSDEQLLSYAKKAGVQASIVEKGRRYEFKKPTRILKKRPVVVGFGPCGIFAAYTLAKYGFKPIVLERGPAMDERVKAVEAFWENGKFNKDANVQFGEGGAGTFSDGKLTTGTKDDAQSFVLESFVDAGASTDILYKKHPHIGTDVLRRVVVNLRRKIELLGGEVRFNSKVSGIRIENGRVTGVEVGDEFIETEDVILALGHSARDSFRYLYEQGIKMEQKPFSMGVRIEHKQSSVDMSQYAELSSVLGIEPAEYKLFTKTSDDRGVYTFCMCPGGYVVAAASEEGMLVTNGMSNMDRGAENANSGLLVDVRTSDYETDHPLSGIDFQEKYERLAFELGGSDYTAPAERLGSFMGQKAGDSVNPSYRPGVKFVSIEKCLPDFVSKALKEAIPKLGRKMKGFDNPDAVLTAIESRSSSPVRIVRDKRLMALDSNDKIVIGLYPGGEGAGYAGGIMSAAVDGIHLAEKVVSNE